MQRWWEDDVQAALKKVACEDVKCIKLAQFWFMADSSVTNTEPSDSTYYQN
jgi:hypothetical protein